MEWTSFLAACLLVAALLVPQAGETPVAAGIALAAFIRWGWYQLHRPHD
jgi:hypothetical protein